VPICNRAMPPLTNCPCCEQSVEIVTLQRDPDNINICTVVYYHHNGDKHFVQYEPKANGELTYDGINSP
jgi:hypothetical protein